MWREENMNTTLLNRETNNAHRTQSVTGFTAVEMLTKKQMANDIIRGDDKNSWIK